MCFQMRWFHLDEPDTSMPLFLNFASVLCTIFLIVVYCVHVMMIAIEGDKFEGEVEAEDEEPVPEIFEQQDFVL